jgi:hypothetical protein
MIRRSDDAARLPRRCLVCTYEYPERGAESAPGTACPACGAVTRHDARSVSDGVRAVDAAIASLRTALRKFED